jgi:proteasome alpha subunit
MPFYVSPEQAMKDKADFARKAITRGRSGVVIDYDAGILFVSPNPSRALHKFSELYDRIAFAAAGRYNEFERLRQAGVRYADLTGYQSDRADVTARGLANWYGQVLGTIFIDSNKPLEVEVVVAEVGTSAEDDQLYRITFDGTVVEEHHYLVMGGQTEQVATVLKERYAEGLTLAGAMAVAVAALASQSGQGGQNGGSERAEFTAGSLEVAVLDRSTTSHRMFRRLAGTRLEALLSQARSSAGIPAPAGEDSPAAAGTGSSPDTAPDTTAPDSTSPDSNGSKGSSGDSPSGEGQT